MQASARCANDCLTASKLSGVLTKFLRRTLNTLPHTSVLFRQKLQPSALQGKYKINTLHTNGTDRNPNYIRKEMMSRLNTGNASYRSVQNTFHIPVSSLET
jgi:hypothetical protein